MDNKTIIIIGLLFILASTSAFVVNIRGDRVYNSTINTTAPAPAVLSVSPQTVPRYCDVLVSAAPNVQVKVLSLNYVDTGLGCKTNSDGKCTFRFNSYNQPGVYYVKAGTSQATVTLDLSSTCVQEVSTLVIDPSSIELAAGMPYVFTTTAYKKDGTAVVPEPSFSLSNSSVGTLSNPSYLSKNQVQFTGVRVGTTTLTAAYGGKSANATIKVTPGACNDADILTPPEYNLSKNYTAGTNATFKVKTTDLYNNTKSNIDVKLVYTMPNSTKVEYENSSDANGVAVFTVDVGTAAGPASVVISPKKQMLCPIREHTYNFDVIPNVPSYIEVLPPVSNIYPDQSAKLVAHVYDEYKNEIKDAVITWSSGDQNIASVDENGNVKGITPGSTVITATTYYETVSTVVQCFPGKGCHAQVVRTQVPISGTAIVNVLNGKESHIVVDPVQGNLVVGSQYQFHATLYDEFNKVVPNTKFVWSADPAVGTIDPNTGVLTAAQHPGTGYVYASAKGLTGNTSVTVVVGQAAHIKAYSQNPSVPVNTHNTIYANVTDMYGNGVKGVTVRYTLLSGNATPASGSAVTDENGTASLDVVAGPAEGEVIYSANVDGTSLTDNAKFTVYIPNVVLSGKVTDYYSGGKDPIEGITVQIENTPYSAVTNASGDYEIKDIDLNGTYNITFSSPQPDKYRAERVAFQLVKDDEDNNYTLNMQLRVLTPISGKVYDSENGQSLQDVNVTLYESGAPINSVLTDANGGFRFTVAPDSASAQYIVTAVLSGYEQNSVGISITPGIPVVLNIPLGGHDVDAPTITFLTPPTPDNGMYVFGQLEVATMASDSHYASTVIEVVSGPKRTEVARCAAFTCTTSIDTAAYNDGQIDVIATAEDKHGNKASVQRTYYVDNVAPALDFVPPTPAGGSTQDAPFTVNVSANDKTGVNKITLNITDGSANTLVKECTGTSVCAYDLNNSEYNGAITVIATAYSALQHAEVSRSFTVLPPKPVLTTLQLSVSSADVYVNDVVSINVTALDEKNNPMQDVEVNFTSNGGTVSPVSVKTDANGHAEVNFTSSNAGSYIITATSGALSNTTSVNVKDIELAVIELSAVPDTILLGEVSTVNARVLDVRGLPVKNAVITFSATGGILLPAQATTDANGIASAQFASLLPGTYTINAASGSLVNSTNITVNIIPPASLDLVAVPDNLQTGGTSIVTATVRDALGQPLSGVTVNFTADGGVIAPASALTDANGRASAQFSAPVVGVYTVNASAGSLTNSVKINVSAGSVPTYLELTASPSSIYTNGESTLTARVLDQYGKGIPNLEVNFSVDGGVLSAQHVYTNESGYAVVKFNSTTEGNYTVNATSNGLENSTVVEVRAAPQPALLQLNANPSTIQAGGSSTITATVLDQYGSPMKDVNVSFAAGNGTVNPNYAPTDANGHASVQFSASVAGDYVINASVNSLSNSTTVVVTMPTGNGILTGTIRNAQGQPIQGANVSVMKNYALQFSALTDANGTYSLSIPADTYDILVDAPGYLLLRDYGVQVNDGGVTEKNYTLTKLSRLYGVVYNTSNATVSGATLKAYRNGYLVSTTTSQADGSYEFLLPSGVYVVETTHPDYMRSIYTLYLPPTTELQKNVTLSR